MRNRSELFQWVENLANEGTWESEGHFTLEQEKAWQKLGSFQLPFPEAWVLKLVQAAVLAACQGLVVRQTGSETVFRFAGQKSWDQKKVTEALFNPGSVSDQGLTPLAAAVRHLARGAGRLLALQYPGGSAQVWDGDAFRSESSPQEIESFQLTVFSATREGARWSFIPRLVAGDSATVAQTLSHLAYTSPVPVVVDGRTINGFSNDPHGGATSSTAPFALLSLKPDVHLPEFRFLRDSEWKRSSEEMYLEMEGEVIELTGPPIGAGALAFLSASLSERSGHQSFEPQPNYLKWIKDGVVVETLKFRPVGSIGVTILVSAEGLRTDLGGLALARDAEFHRRKEQVIKRTRSRLRALLEDDLSKTLSLKMKGLTHTLAILASAGAGFVQPIFFGFTGLAAAQLLSDKLRIRRREWQLRDDLTTLCREF